MHVKYVTLHVSVWVEIDSSPVPEVNNTGHAPRERVSWNLMWDVRDSVGQTSRSTWACELKFHECGKLCWAFRHAPRERVSWNWIYSRIPTPKPCHAPRERVSWNKCRPDCRTDLKCHAPRERVSWNHLAHTKHYVKLCHAPRERVSWNSQDNGKSEMQAVTLHVSVWVEIQRYIHGLATTLSRSTWACELK